MRKLTSVYFEEISSKTTKLSYVLPSNGLSIEFDQVQSFIMSTLSFSGLSRDTFIYIASGVGTLIFVIVIITVLYCCIRTKRKAKRKATISKETSARLIPTIERISSNKRASTTSSAASYIKPRDINVEYSRNVHTPAEYVKLKQENDEDQGRLSGGYSGSSTKIDTNNQHTLTPPSAGSYESEQPQNYAELKVSLKPIGSTQYVKMVGRSIEGGPYITPPIHSTEISRPESYIDLTENNLGLSRNSEKFKEGDYNSVSQADIKNGVESESETNDYQNSPRKRKELIKPVEETRNEYVNTLSISNNHEAAYGNSQGNEFDFNQKDTCRNYENSSNLAKQKQDGVVYANLTEKLTPIPAVRENCVQKDKNKGKRMKPTPPKRRPFVKKDNQNINSQVEQIPTRRESITKNKEIKERPERPASVKHSDESEVENNYNDVLEVEITKRESSVECSNINRQEKRDSSYVDMEGVTLYQEETPLENT